MEVMNETEKRLESLFFPIIPVPAMTQTGECNAHAPNAKQTNKSGGETLSVTVSALQCTAVRRRPLENMLNSPEESIHP